MTHADLKERLMQLSLEAQSKGGDECRQISKALTKVAVCMELRETEDAICSAISERHGRLIAESSIKLKDTNRKADRCAELGISDVRLLDYLEGLEANVKFLNDLLSREWKLEQSSPHLEGIAN